MKRLYILMITVLFIVGLTACGKKTTAVPETTAAAESAAEETGTETADTQPKEISGKVMDAAMHSLILKSDKDGAELSFGTEGADIHLEDGLTIGLEVIILYTGEIKGTDTSGVTVLEIKDKADNQSLDGSDQELSDFNILQGTVEAGSETSESITIQTETGTRLTFRGADVGGIVTTSEIAPGKQVALAYQGDYNGRNLTGIRLLLMLDDQATWEVRIAEGTTVYNMMSSFEIQTVDGQQISFLKNGCGQDEGVMTKDSGDRVTVTYVTTQTGENHPLHIGVME